MPYLLSPRILDSLPKVRVARGTWPSRRTTTSVYIGSTAAAAAIYLGVPVRLGMEPVSLAIGVPSVAILLATTALEGCRIFQKAQVVGTGIRLREWELDVCETRLEEWIHELKTRGGDLAQLVGGKSKK